MYLCLRVVLETIGIPNGADNDGVEKDDEGAGAEAAAQQQDDDDDEGQQEKEKQYGGEEDAEAEAAAQQQNDDDEQEQQQEELTCRVRKESYRGRGKTIALRDCSARNVPGTCVIFFVGSGPRATRPL